ncbi:hypothetical protein D3C76_1525900 [compost metagenome]
MSQYRNELFAQPAKLPGVVQFHLGSLKAALSVEAHCNQLGEQCQCLRDCRFVQVRRD